MYTLITRVVLEHHRISTKTIRKESILINDLNSLLIVPVSSRVLVFFDQSIPLAFLLDLKAALNLQITIIANNQMDYDLCRLIFDTRLITYDFIDGALIRGIAINDDKQVEALTKNKRVGMSDTSTYGLLEEAKKVMLSQSTNEKVRLIASAFVNKCTVEFTIEHEWQQLKKEVTELSEKQVSIINSLNEMSNDTEDFIKAYSQMQAQVSARNILDVIKDNSALALPSGLTSLVIKNYGVPHLMNFVSALKDSLSTSYNRHTKVIYVCEPDGVSLHEVNRAGFFMLSGSVQAADILKNDMFICIGNVKAPIEFLLNTSTMDTLIIVDSRRSLTQLISGQTLTMYTAMDAEVANNLGLDPNVTITSSERSVYTLKESDFFRKKRHALRNNDLVTSVVNTLLEGGRE